MTRLALPLCLLLLVPACGDGGDDANGTAGGGVETRCTLVIGYSQVAQWYSGGGAFEQEVDDGAWELLAAGGHGVDVWKDPDDPNWSDPVSSPCVDGPDDPDRALLSISGPHGDDEAAWAADIAAVIDVIRDKYPSVGPIMLQPVVGGPDHGDCMFESNLVRASWQHKHIDNAIATVVGADVIAGFSPEVRTCDDYRDGVGHLTDDAEPAIGREIGRFYASP